jgi:chemotaxis protein methyltransferase CheR
MVKVINEELSPVDFENFRNYVKNICGISIPQDKVYLVQQRLLPLVKLSGCRNFTEFYCMIADGTIPCIRESVISAITTNETSFFRDEHPFQTFKNQILPNLVNLIRKRTVQNDLRRGPRTKIWCSGSSTGQEPYCVAMLIREYLNQHPFGTITDFDFQVLATDISSEVLGKAIAGTFSETEINKGLPEEYKKQFFTKLGNKWILNEDVRKMVDFRKVNLTESFMLLGTFDVIFCRNVLIYFEKSVRDKILAQFHRILSDPGFLILGASEVLIGPETQGLFESQKIGQTILYKKK